MASPQLENGYMPIANELFEAFYRCKMVEYERVVVMHIWRQTYGWGKKSDWISNTQFWSTTGIPKPHVTRTLKSLKDKKIVTSSGNKISVNKNYKEWKVEWRVLPHQVTTVTSSGNKKLPHQVPTKDNKYTLQNKGEKANASSSLKELKNNQKDMPWNRPGDDADDTVVDYDTGEVKSTAPVSKKKYPNALAVFKVFLEVTGKFPANWKINRTELQAAENLFAERGLEKIRNALQFYQEHQDEPYCPQITQPSDLDAKWTKLGGFKLKQK